MIKNNQNPDLYAKLYELHGARIKIEKNIENE